MFLPDALPPPADYYAKNLYLRAAALRLACLPHFVTILRCSQKKFPYLSISKVGKRGQIGRILRHTVILCNEKLGSYEPHLSHLRSRSTSATRFDLCGLMAMVSKFPGKTLMGSLSAVKGYQLYD
ncbi:MAG: hypothetical protein Q8K59_06410 [Nitrosomonas sp.]|nr:hypothetical protein [Nitrosomonas sp.]MDP1950713.1 hypothetical protein [Nitrosomonas sp.]